METILSLYCLQTEGQFMSVKNVSLMDFI